MNENNSTSETSDIGIVIYAEGTDMNSGSLKGFCGSAIHGYSYDTNNIGSKLSYKHPKNVTTEEGYTTNKSNPDILVNPLSYIDVFKVGTSNPTNNNTSGLHSFVLGLHYASIKKCTKLVIITENIYIVDGINNIKDMKKEDFDKKDNIPDKDIWMEIKKLYDDNVRTGCEIKVIKTKAHSNRFGTDIATKLASVGRYQHSFNTKLSGEVYSVESEPKGYWKPTPYVNPFFKSVDRFFFKTNVKETDENGTLYRILRYTKPDEKPEDTAKRDNGATCAYIYTKQPDKNIEYLKYMFGAMNSGREFIASVISKVLFSPQCYRYVNLFGSTSYTVEKTIRIGDVIKICNEETVVKKLYPPGQAKHVIENSGFVDNIFDSYYKWSNNYDKKLPYAFINITSLIYTENNKGKVIIRPEINNDAENTKIPYNVNGIDINIPITIGTDTMTRNQFKSIESDDVSVVVVIENQHNKVIKYYTIVEDKTIDTVGLYCSYYSNEFYII